MRIFIYNARLEAVAKGETAQVKLELYDQSGNSFFRRKLCCA